MSLQEMDVEHSAQSENTTQPAQQSPANSVMNEHLTIVPTRGGDGLGLSIKVEGSGRIFRIEPARDPNQPRFWCFRVYRCSAAGVISQTERSWWGQGNMTRAELPAAVDAIRNDPNKWLADADLAVLRSWIMENDEEPATPSAAELRRAAVVKASVSMRNTTAT
jgi:hypothetical protein